MQVKRTLLVALYHKLTQFLLHLKKLIYSRLQASYATNQASYITFILLSNCVGGPFGKKWTDVEAEWNERSEVHSSADGGPFFHEWND